jgi:hypothetical protein
LYLTAASNGPRDYRHNQIGWCLKGASLFRPQGVFVVKLLQRIVLISAPALLAFPLIAAAVTVAPAGNFSATGTLSLGKSIIHVSCETTFAGTVSASGIINVSVVTFGKGSFLCKHISPVGLPWSGEANSDSALTINAMQVNIDEPLLGGICGPIDVQAEWEKDLSAAHFNHAALPPSCSVDGVMMTTPHITVSP